MVDHKGFYEALHFHELEVRERVSGRLQISLGLVIALASALAFLFGNFDQRGSGIAFQFLIALLEGADPRCLQHALNCFYTGLLAGAGSMRDHSRHASYNVVSTVIPPTRPNIGIATAFARADSKIMKVSR